MAHITDAHVSNGSVRETLNDLIAGLRTYFAKRREINTTFAELNELSDRELADLGIARYDIKRIAMDVASAK